MTLTPPVSLWLSHVRFDPYEIQNMDNWAMLALIVCPRPFKIPSLGKPGCGSIDGSNIVCSYYELSLLPMGQLLSDIQMLGINCICYSFLDQWKSRLIICFIYFVEHLHY